MPARLLARLGRRNWRRETRRWGGWETRRSWHVGALAAEIDTKLGSLRGLRLTPPLPYPEMIGLLRSARLVITDSGGIQEEAATLGVPLLVTRESTERPEILSLGRAELVGTDPERIYTAAAHWLADDERVAGVGGDAQPSSADEPTQASAVTPATVFGDGFAAQRSLTAIAALLGVPDHPQVAWRGRAQRQGPTPARV